MGERQTALTNKIDEMITQFPNDRLERKLVHLDTVIIEEMDHI